MSEDTWANILYHRAEAQRDALFKRDVIMDTTMGHGGDSSHRPRPISEERQTNAFQTRFVNANIRSLESSIFEESRLNVEMAEYIRQLQLERKIMTDILEDIHERREDSAARCAHFEALQRMLGNSKYMRRHVMDRVNNRILHDTSTSSSLLSLPPPSSPTYEDEREKGVDLSEMQTIIDDMMNGSASLSHSSHAPLFSEMSRPTRACEGEMVHDGRPN